MASLVDDIACHDFDDYELQPSMQGTWPQRDTGSPEVEAEHQQCSRQSSVINLVQSHA